MATTAAPCSSSSACSAASPRAARWTARRSSSSSHGGTSQAEAARALAVFEALGAAPEAERARQLVESFGAEAAGRSGDLTPREQEVVHLLADGLTNRQIAERLVVSEHTVHRHVTNILRKLSLPSRAAAAAYAVRAGLSTGGD